MKSRSLCGVLFSLLLFGGCGDDYDCSDACGKVIDECHLELYWEGTLMTKEMCLTACKEAKADSSDLWENAIECIQEKSCDTIHTCINV